LKLADD
jgi:hypothetical protein